MGGGPDRLRMPRRLNPRSREQKQELTTRKMGSEGNARARSGVLAVVCWFSGRPTAYPAGPSCWPEAVSRKRAAMRHGAVGCRLLAVGRQLLLDGTPGTITASDNPYAGCLFLAKW